MTTTKFFFHNTFYSFSSTYLLWWPSWCVHQVFTTVYLWNMWVFFLNKNKNVNLLWEGADTHPLILSYIFHSHSIDSHSALLANGSHEVFTSDSCICCKSSKRVSLASMLHQWVQEMAQHIGWELIFFVRLLSPSSSASSTVARWLGVCWPGSGKLSALGRSSSKLGCSGEFMCLRLGDGLSFFLPIFLCQSFRQILEAGIYWLTAFCVGRASGRTGNVIERHGKDRKVSAITGKPLPLYGNS